MFANIQIGGFQLDMAQTNQQTRQISPMNKGGIYMASPISMGEESTPQCSALLKYPGLQTSPSPDTRNKVFEVINHQGGLSLKSQSWMAASQKLNNKDGC